MKYYKVTWTDTPGKLPTKTKINYNKKMFPSWYHYGYVIVEKGTIIKQLGYTYDGKIYNYPFWGIWHILNNDYNLIKEEITKEEFFIYCI